MSETLYPDLFVSTQWLAENLQAPDILVVDGTFFMPDEGRNAQKEYLEAHIPGAVFFDIDGIADLESALPHMLPETPFFENKMTTLGLNPDTRVVVYDTTAFPGAARVWWTLRIFGVEDVKILEGGLPAWKAEGRPLESGAVDKPFSKFYGNLDEEHVADAMKVLAASKSGSHEIIDARQAQRFRGEVAEPRPGVRSGHIPGSKNVPWRDVVTDDGKLKDKPEIEKAFVAAGVDLNKPLLTSCGSGVTAAVLLLALEAIGKKGVTLYDGSWSEWGARSDLPIATGAA